MSESNWKRLQKKSAKNSKSLATKSHKFTNILSPIIKQDDHVKKEKFISNRQKEVGKYLAIDCEFVGIGPDGASSELARVSIVNFYGVTIYDTFVKPTEKVTDWRTWVSGVTSKDMKTAITFKEAQTHVSSLIKGKILVGHAIDHDLDSLFLSHPRAMIRDTAKHGPFRKKYANGKTPSLKKLSLEILKLDIQGGQHSSVEDAKATMMIYKSDKAEFEKLHDLKFNKNKNRRTD